MNSYLKKTDFRHILDQMAKNAFSGKEVELCDAVQDFYRTGLSCSVFPEPEDTDHKTLAMKAAIIERVAQVFTMPPHNRRYELPDWCKNNWSCPKTVCLISEDILSSDEPNAIFQKRNIRTLNNFLYFV
ncbi:hypothetical protein QUF80_06300 [Desulfococcaceae bacterium HSG8]|nr:hypothetical protein [Desulfococcaceae bacterium HSG8]